MRRTKKCDKKCVVGTDNFWFIRLRCEILINGEDNQEMIYIFLLETENSISFFSCWWTDATWSKAWVKLSLLFGQIFVKMSAYRYRGNCIEECFRSYKDCHSAVENNQPRNVSSCTFGDIAKLSIKKGESKEEPSQYYINFIYASLVFSRLMNRPLIISVVMNRNRNILKTSRGTWKLSGPKITGFCCGYC